MAKTITKFICGACGYETGKWLGKCPGCSEWNTFIEEKMTSNVKNKKEMLFSPLPLTSVPKHDIYRISSGYTEFDRVLGSGIVPGSTVLLGGDPGIGKSTLLLQIADKVAVAGKPVLYLCGEESLSQVRLRSLRLKIENENIVLIGDADIDQLTYYVKSVNPQLLIVDSIQTVYTGNIASIPGSISQLRECTAKITELVKATNMAAFLAGHVTKEGNLAGPKVLEHMVDIVIYFEGEKNYAYRILRSIKNRFGPTDEIGLLEMSGSGLEEVIDPSCVFLSPSSESGIGVSVAASCEGTRPLLIEVQALVVSASAGYARRMASGIDHNRLSLIIAVLEKRLGYQLAAKDVYLKVTGGLFLKDPSLDLSIAAAIVSSYLELPVDANSVLIGELGLSGHIRAVPFLDQRLKEVERLGYKKVIVPYGVTEAWKNNMTKSGLEIIGIKTIEALIDLLAKG